MVICVVRLHPLQTFETDVYALANYMNREVEVIPRSTIIKPPSAELKPGQTDQDSLLPYDVWIDPSDVY